ncbi:MAG: PhnD/SsuA/transferrin family substrate-binding protein [Desulfobulbaceae bacterium]|nr:PhnD/SsuA/transferrin family substrate-binding protein [Desulfobulbaceae bacterium]
MTFSFRLLIFLFFFLLLHADSLFAADQQHLSRIGVLAKRGTEVALQKWSPTADYLSASIPGYRFEIVPLGFSEIHEAVQDRQIDFVLANPAFYVELEKLYGVSRIATLININLPGQPTTTFGSVIFTRSDRNEISTLADLKGLSFMAVDSRSFGGWIMAWREFENQKINPQEDFSTFRFGNTHDAVVYAVLRGEVDAGTVRSDTLERMAEYGLIKLDDFRILNAQPKSSFPFLLSTQLYPEWPIAALRETPNRLSRLVASSLMKMDVKHPAAKASKSAGWTVPLNYQPVHECLLQLKIGPYADFGTFTLTDVLMRYWRQIAFIICAGMAIIVIAFYIFWLNRRLLEKKQEVEGLNATLENKVELRTEKINSLLMQEKYLRTILRTVAEINELLVTSSSLESLLVDCCARFVQHKHYGFCWIGLLGKNKITEIYTADGAEKIGEDSDLLMESLDSELSLCPAVQSIASNTTVIRRKSWNEIDKTSWTDYFGISEFESVIGIPLRADQYAEPLGALTVYTWREQGFEQEEISMLEELAGDIGFAIQSFRHREAVAKLMVERTQNYEQTLFSMVNMIEHRDPYTAGHTTRVAHYSELIARGMGVEESEIIKLKKAAILHDIGKIATPDSILLKPNVLTSRDYDLIKLHASAGYEILSQINMYKELAEIILHHHERHDGRGYPDALKGDEIHPLARIMVVADAFDAMTTNRIYKPRKKIKEALAELESLSGSQFHPEVVKVAVQVLKDVAIAGSINQLPKTDLEKKRFSYFFNDKLTGLYNEDYLKIVLNNNRELHEYGCMHILHLKNIERFNKRQGWGKGDLLLQKFAGELVSGFPEALIFRAYGNDFAIIARKHFEVDRKALKVVAGIEGTEIELEIHHVDLMKRKTYTINKLDKLELLSSDDDSASNGNGG